MRLLAALKTASSEVSVSCGDLRSFACCSSAIRVRIDQVFTSSGETIPAGQSSGGTWRESPASVNSRKNTSNRPITSALVLHLKMVSTYVTMS